LKKLKSVYVVAATALLPFNPDEKILIQTDASQVGLGVMVLQNNKPVAYAFRMLTDTEKSYSAIERECLAISFACQKCHLYIYSRPVKIVTDHKPLLAVFQKDIHNLPLSRLRTIGSKILHYRITLTYLPGRFMFVPDCLSRVTSQECDDDTEDLDVMIHSFSQSLPMSDERKNDFRECTESDPVLCPFMRELLSWSFA